MLKHYIMKTAFRILKITFFSLLILFCLLFFLIRYRYDIQIWNMTRKLNKIPNTEVLNIWGHKDITLEEISARLKVGDSNEIVITNLSKDVFNFPEEVFINEINGYSFIVYQKDCGLFNIGIKSPIYKDLGITFYTPEDVVQNIDSIYNFVRQLKLYPEINYFCDTVTKTEMYLHIINNKSNDIDPINSLFHIEEKIKFAKTLDWKYWDYWVNGQKLG